ncbi:hypothetical protein PGB90_003585 [Kerria lacca]
MREAVLSSCDIYSAAPCMWNGQPYSVNMSKSETRQNKKNNGPENSSNITSAWIAASENQTAYNMSTDNSTSVWKVDSGSKSHLINNNELFYEFRELRKPYRVRLADNKMYINAIKHGTVKIKSKVLKKKLN